MPQNLRLKMPMVLHRLICRGLAVSLIAAGWAALATQVARAQAKLDAEYGVTLLGLPIGSGTWSVELSGDHYVMNATGKVAGIMKVFSSGEGAASVRGAISGAKLLPAGYAINIKAGGKADQVRMALASSTVKQLSVEPPPEPKPDRVPLTDANKRGITDPISSGIFSVGDKGLTPEVCQRTAPIFDGRIRFDLALSFKKMAKVKTEKGYAGPAVICSVKFNPIGGHEAHKSGIRFLRETRDIEIWYAPIEGTHFVAMYKIMLPTQLGIAAIEAKRFVVAPLSVRAGATGVKTQ